MLSTSISTVPEEKSARGKRRDPNYAQLVGDVPKGIIQRFKINCLKKGMTIGEALTEAVQTWNEKIESED
jgi:hypothetical protein